MKNDLLISDTFQETSAINAMEAMLAVDGSFTATRKTLGLKKETDFRHSDLSGVDFSYSDLRGFDFFGADLRNSRGVDVIFDSTTNLENATVSGSLFAKWVREEKLYSNNPSSVKRYEILKNSNYSETTKWLSYKFRQGPDTHRLLRHMDDREATVQSQKLIVDDINLTKRTDLFYYLNLICPSPEELRELVLDVLARHLENTGVVKSFAKVAGALFYKDEFITSTLLMLCKDPRVGVREAAFSAISNTKLFLYKFQELSNLFFGDSNYLLRKQLIYSTAILSGSQFVRTVNLKAKSEDVDLGEILDFDELLDDAISEKISINSKMRIPNSGEKSGNYRATRETTPLLHSRPLSKTEIVEMQEEVIVNTPILSEFIKIKKPHFFEAAQNRLEKKYDQTEKTMIRRIEKSYRR